MTIEELREVADSRGIEVYDFPMKELRAVALASGHIAIDRSKMASDTEYKCVLAHEIGHCETDSFYTMQTSEQVRELCERKANRFAAELLVPFSKLVHAIHERGICIARTLAKLFDVTLEFINMVLELYEQELASPAYRRQRHTNTYSGTISSGETCSPTMLSTIRTLKKASDLIPGAPSKSLPLQGKVAEGRMRSSSHASTTPRQLSVVRRAISALDAVFFGTPIDISYEE